MCANDISKTITNLDLFEEFFSFIQSGNSLEDTLKEYGGTTYYIPSHKTTCRNKDIIKEYKEHYGEVGLAKRLAKLHDLSERQILEITKEVRQASSLF